VGLRPRQWKFPVQSISDARLDAAHPWLHRVFFNVSVPDPVQGANDSLIVMWQAKDGSIAESLVRQLPHRTPANVANPKPDQPVPGAVARPDVWRSGPLVGIRLGSSPAPWHRYHASSVPWYRYESDSSAVNDALPDRCFYCNASANGYRFKRRFRYVKNAVGRAFISTLFLSNPGAALGTEAWMTKEVEVQLGLCEEHERECVPWPGTKAWIFISMPTFFMFLISIRATQPWIGFFLLVAAAIWWIKSRIRKPVGHLEGLDDQAVWISGAGNAFLDSLPTA
jgi:hypothetical protein